MRAKTAFSALIILIFLIPGISSAENPDIEKARKARDLAEQAIVEGRFCDAAIELVAVYDYVNNRDALFNAAVAAERAGDFEFAAHLFERFAAKAPLSPQRPVALERIEDLRKRIKAGESSVTCQRKDEVREEVEEEDTGEDKEISKLHESGTMKDRSGDLTGREFEEEEGERVSGWEFDPEIIIRAGFSGHAGVLGIAGEIRPLPWMGIALGTGLYSVGGGLTFGGPEWRGFYVDVHTVWLKPTPIGGSEVSKGIGIGASAGMDIRIMERLRVKLGGGVGWKSQREKEKEEVELFFIDATISPVIRSRTGK